jgi:16S rRNA G527 N7-methylase RsmG
MSKELWLNNVTTHRWRAEEARFQVDVLTSRAVSFADQLFHRALPLVKPWGILVFYKLFTEQEDNAILSLTRRYHLTLKKLHHYNLPDDDVERVIYVLEKSVKKA